MRLFRQDHELRSPDKGQDGGRDSEGYDIGQGVYLAAEIADCVGHTRDAAIEPIQKNGDADHLGRPLEMVVRPVVAGHYQHGALKTLEYRDKPKKQIAGREHGRQCIGGTAGPTVGRTRIDESVGEAFHFVALLLARTLEPAWTRSPACTAISHSGPNITSTREPNLIKPI